MPRIGSSEEIPICSDFPQLPINDVGEFQYPYEIGELEKKLLERLTVDKCKLNEIESKTTDQADSETWKNERKFRFTASNFGLIMNRRRNHSTLVQNMLHPKPLSFGHTAHGKKYESVHGLNAVPTLHVFYSKKSQSLIIRVCCLPGLTNPWCFA